MIVLPLHPFEPRHGLWGHNTYYAATRSTLWGHNNYYAATRSTSVSSSCTRATASSCADCIRISVPAFSPKAFSKRIVPCSPAKAGAQSGAVGAALRRVWIPPFAGKQTRSPRSPVRSFVPSCLRAKPASFNLRASAPPLKQASPGPSKNFPSKIGFHLLGLPRPLCARGPGSLETVETSGHDWPASHRPDRVQPRSHRRS